LLMFRAEYLCRSTIFSDEDNQRQSKYLHESWNFKAFKLMLKQPKSS
jgi:hypothetical protein